MEQERKLAGYTNVSKCTVIHRKMKQRSTAKKQWIENIQKDIEERKMNSEAAVDLAKNRRFVETFCVNLIVNKMLMIETNQKKYPNYNRDLYNLETAQLLHSRFSTIILPLIQTNPIWASSKHGIRLKVTKDVSIGLFNLVQATIVLLMITAIPSN
jgi:AAA15 family ATPase/GTPase